MFGMGEERVGSGVGRPGLRSSDADREQLISELHDHTVAGRLSTDELEQRLEAAYAARTSGELDALRSDLPSPAMRPGASIQRAAAG